MSNNLFGNVFQAKDLTTLNVAVLSASFALSLS
jgi:hypothetical protein